ncbi:isoprenylcysteine carboxylmethyltransferase family protein [Phenylobacterium sp.]|uniref:methyltransferase family protein n=1 Tax=Phenylobacterium sp. TaxID=1871053 RepID=UPI0025DAACDB|nr:isoprenylcysteine carboxylmethyltransferase family protein [Phenylobacterium sp.]
MAVLKGLFAALAVVMAVAALLLVPAGLTAGGTWVWLRAWIAVAAIAIASGAGSAALAVFRPANFAMRQQGPVASKPQRQPLIDAVGLVAFLVYLVAWTAFIPLDVFSLRLLPSPSTAASLAGGLACVAGLLITQVAVAQNKFAAPTIHDQSADGQMVVDTGLYGLVRHPLYAGNLLFYAGLALWLGSTAALVGVVGLLLFTLARIVIEEGYLRANLPAYADYARRVRGRLIPFVF